MRAKLPVFALAVIAACWLWPSAHAQTPPAIPLQAAPQQLPPRARDADRQPLAWDSLNQAQQRLLAPFREQWATLPPERQHRLARNAVHWATLPADRQQHIRERLTRFANMTPAERDRLRANARAFHALPPAEQARIRAAFHRFRSLSPAEQKVLRERWRQRREIMRGQPAAAHTAPIPLHAPPSTGGH